ncbi:hypothetical protein E2C01_011744 [Portunus trituberculatus]|uniref:Uncharacterized protein n=1 Tax=Portunus trituberculatus TaxID=210409 RepID=A0A5B7DC34_PORTR|nr:hypothetical protein [Portunus trituberculatus]
MNNVPGKDNPTNLWSTSCGTDANVYTTSIQSSIVTASVIHITPTTAMNTHISYQYKTVTAPVTHITALNASWWQHTHISNQCSIVTGTTSALQKIVLDEHNQSSHQYRNLHKNHPTFHQSNTSLKNRN